MATKVVQVKVRVRGDNLTWETRQVAGEFIVHTVKGPNDTVYVHAMSGLTLVEKAMNIGLCYPGAVEIRWNFKESLQGHYNDVKGAY